MVEDQTLYFLLPFARRTRTQRRSWDLGDGTPGLDADYDFVEKPRPAFGFVDPGLDQACGGYIVVLVAVLHTLVQGDVTNRPLPLVLLLSGFRTIRPGSVETPALGIICERTNICIPAFIIVSGRSPGSRTSRQP